MCEHLEPHEGYQTRYTPNLTFANTTGRATTERNLAQIGVRDAWVSCTLSIVIDDAWVPARPYDGDGGER